MHFIQLKTLEEKEAVLERMQSQKHYVPDVSHIFTDDQGEMKGAFSRHWLPLVFIWFDTEAFNPVVTIKAFKYIRDVLGPLYCPHTQGRLVWPIDKRVPPFRIAERVGLTFGGNAHFFMSEPGKSKPTP